MLVTKLAAFGIAFCLCEMSSARAAEPTPAAEPPVYETVVTGTTPLHGSRLPRDHVPANVQSLSAEDLAEHHSLDLSSYMGEALGSVNINSVQGNPLQPDLQYRGFLASPLLGAPQGLSMYLDGVRLNEPFGDTINWDLIPTNAIRSVNVLPGSNPIFGLNTLGGALSLDTKTGFSDPGLQGSLLYGSFNRKLALASGGLHGERFGVFAAAQVFDEDGWRASSPTRSEHAFVSTSYENAGTTADLVLLGANTSLTGNGAAPAQLLYTDRRAVFTTPDRTENQLLMALLRGERPLATHVRVSGTAYVRTNRTRSVNGDQREWARCLTMPGSLCATDDDGTEAPVVDGAGQPVMFSDTFDAAMNRTDTHQTSYGAAAQLSVDAPLFDNRENHLFVGADAGQSHVRFRSRSNVARLNDARGTEDAGFLDPTSLIAVDSVVDDVGLYASDTVTPLPNLYVVLSGRLNVSTLTLEDQLGDALNGDHSFFKLNPAVGVSYQPRPWLGGYFNISQSNRAPTAVELTCASPTDPCRLPNAFVADPPLNQVVAVTLEAGVRGVYRHDSLKLDYDATAFQTTNSNDILFISSGAVANQGYFSNVGQTRRRGLETSLRGARRLGEKTRVAWDVHYTLTDATFETPFEALSANHPDADPTTRRIMIPAGAHLPGVPRHVAKAGLSVVTARGLSAGVNVVANSGQYLRGDEANRLAPVPGHVVVNLRVAYQVARPVSVFALVNNVFNARYSTFGVLGDATDVLGASYDSPRFLGPAPPLAAWLGVELRY
ncbi:MAG: TonB-dependent receptor [Myxococcales bacterium]|nr:TonB-dependent receptor [Myxococcales bacterium]